MHEATHKRGRRFLKFILLVSILAVVLVAAVFGAKFPQSALAQVADTRSLPPGVTLRAIDGGATYYADNRFTNAVNAGWDGSFFPVGNFLTVMTTQSDFNRMLDLNMNTIFVATSNTPIKLARSNGLSVIQTVQPGSGLTADQMGTETVGILSFDEPQTFTQGIGGPIGGTRGATFTASISGSLMTVTGVADGEIYPGATISGAGVRPGTTVSIYGTGNGGVGTYGVNISQTVGGQSMKTGATTATPNGVQDGRFWWMNLTSAWLVYGGLHGTPPPPASTPASQLAATIATPNGAPRHIDIQSIDFYWFAACKTGNANLLASAGNVVNKAGGAALTVDQCVRGSHYGDVVDMLRPYQTGSGTFPAPIFQIVENGGPFQENSDGSSYISPPEMNWAVWASILHGARGIIYFNASYAGPGVPRQPGFNGDNFGRSTYFTAVQPGQTISIYDQAKTTNALIKQMAPVINAPFALNYASVSPAGYTFPTATQVINDSVDIMTKYYQGTFYVFACTRASEATTNLRATFTVASGSSVTVINENRSIPISNGHFTDTFAHAWDVHIYKVNP